MSFAHYISTPDGTRTSQNDFCSSCSSSSSSGKFGKLGKMIFEGVIQMEGDAKRLPKEDPSGLLWGRIGGVQGLMEGKYKGANCFGMRGYGGGATSESFLWVLTMCIFCFCAAAAPAPPEE
jgi:hypothetical protein